MGKCPANRNEVEVNGFFWWMLLKGSVGCSWNHPCEISVFGLLRNSWISMCAEGEGEGGGPRAFSLFEPWISMCADSCNVKDFSFLKCEPRRIFGERDIWQNLFTPSLGNMLTVTIFGTGNSSKIEVWFLNGNTDMWHPYSLPVMIGPSKCGEGVTNHYKKH